MSSYCIGCHKYSRPSIRSKCPNCSHGGARKGLRRGKGFFGDMAKSGLKILAPKVIDALGDLAKNKVNGMGVGGCIRRGRGVSRSTVLKHRRHGRSGGGILSETLAKLLPL